MGAVPPRGRAMAPATRHRYAHARRRASNQTIARTMRNNSTGCTVRPSATAISVMTMAMMTSRTMGRTHLSTSCPRSTRNPRPPRHTFGRAGPVASSRGPTPRRSCRHPARASRWSSEGAGPSHRTRRLRFVPAWEDPQTGRGPAHGQGIRPAAARAEQAAQAPIHQGKSLRRPPRRRQRLVAGARPPRCCDRHGIDVRGGRDFRVSQRSAAGTREQEAIEEDK